MTNYIPKEISWLSFNERVLQEADNSDIPLLERIKFLGIYSNNLDEFFRVRVAILNRLSKLESKAIGFLGYDPVETLNYINDIVLKQRTEYESIYKKLIQELAENNILILNEKQLDEEQTDFVDKYFKQTVSPQLMPFLIQDDSKLPILRDDSIYFAITLKNNKEKKEQYALLEIPTNHISRFVLLPEKNNNKYIIFLDDVIRFGLKKLFFLFYFDEISAYTIKITKDAELDIVDDISESYLEAVSKSLKMRKTGDPVRFVYDRKIPEKFLKIITKKLKISKTDTLISGGRYHNLKDLIGFPDLGLNHLKYPNPVSVQHKDLPEGNSILSAIRKKDIMLFFPYHSFDFFINLIRESSIDPDIKSIQITLYRVAKNSSVINALINAVRNGKKVTVIMELQARFDEEANIYWSTRLVDGGVKVIYGVKGLKVHSKLCLITSEKNGKVQKFACVGTGNFNEDTAKIYTDHLLLTADLKITNEVYKVFNFFNKNYKKENFYHLVVSPYYLRKKINKLIKNETKNAKAGKKAFIYIKINNLVDIQVIKLLYEAHNAGVEIKLIVRGMFSMTTGVKNLSHKIKATGIVDRFLEHTRFLIFCNGGDEKYFITSADLMARNLDRRIEVTCPVFDKSIQKDLKQIFKIQLKDNVKARILDQSLINKYVQKGVNEHRSQYEIYDYLKVIHSINN